VAALDPATREIRFKDGTTLAYDAALLATGGVPRRRKLANDTIPGLFVLRTQSDSDATLACARTARRCVVLGAGLIGMEAAAALRERGLAVTVVAPRSAPFEHQLGTEVGNALAGLHRSRGMEFRLGRQAKALERDRFRLNRFNGAITLLLFVQTRDSRFGVTRFEAITL
jgi:NAD(P)H-nitrite reductase large subunit